MNKPVIGGLRDRVSPEEWQTRLDLAACYRLFVHYRMTDMIYTHVTSRVPGTEDQILINPYGLMFDEITASNLYKIDYDGNVILRPETEYDINRSGYRLHTALHKARPDAACVLHTHSLATVTVSTMKCGLLPLTQPALRFFNRVSYTKYDAAGFDDHIQAQIIADLGQNDVMLMHNHGTIVVGRSMAEAFNLLYNLEMSCLVQMHAMQSGTELVLVNERVAEETAMMLGPKGGTADGVMDGRREWSALRRMLDRKDPGYAD